MDIRSMRGSEMRMHQPSETGDKDQREILRFDRVERLAHWVNAAFFTALILTALPLYFGQVEALVGRRAVIAEIHTWTGILLPVPLLISMSGSWGKRFRADISRFGLWTQSELNWLRSIGRYPLVESDKFNPGQKLNALFIGSSIVVMFGTGFILHWFNFFPLDWRTGATFVHDVLAFAIVVVILGHIFFALTHREALKSIFTGHITRSWAAQHAKRWFAEEAHGSLED